MVSQMVPYLPCYDGFRIIPANLIRELSKRHEIFLIALTDGAEDADQLQWPEKYCRSVEILRIPIRWGLANRLDQIARPVASEVSETVRAHIQGTKPDVLHLEGPGTAPLARLAPLRALTILSAHDALSLRYREFARFTRSRYARIGYTSRSLLAERFERRWFRYAHRVVVTSFFDLEVLSGSVPQERLAVIPNGVDLEYWTYRPAPQPGRIVFTGNMNWPPNEDAAEYFTVDVLPLVQRWVPDAEFCIVGAQPSLKVKELARIPGVRVTGTVPDLREWICSAAVYVSALRFGAGVKNKILEAMALGTPIVATPQSLTGTPLVHGRHLLVADSAAEIAEAVLRLLGDGELRRSLSEEARRHLEMEYSWEWIAARFEKLYRAQEDTLAPAAGY